MLTLDGSTTARLAMGSHDFSAMLRVQLFDLVGVKNLSLRPPAESALLAFNVPVQISFDVFDKAHEPFVVITDDTWRLAIKSAIREPKIIVTASKKVIVFAFISKPVVRLSFQPFIIAQGSKQEIALNSELSCPANSAKVYHGDVQGWLETAAHADLIFRPALDGVRDTLDASPIWGEDVVIHDVPIERGN